MVPFPVQSNPGRPSSWKITAALCSFPVTAQPSCCISQHRPLTNSRFNCVKCIMWIISFQYQNMQHYCRTWYVAIRDSRACQSEFSSKSPYWRTKSCTDSRHNTLVRSTALPTCLAVDLFVLPTPTVWWCRRSGCQLLPNELSRWPAHKSGMIYRLKWRLLNRWPHSASDWKLTFFKITSRLPPGH